MPDVEHVAVVDLNVRDLKLRDAINYDATSVILLTTRLRVEACTIQEDTEGCVVGDLLGGGQERLLVVYSNNLGSNVPLLCANYYYPYE